MNETDSEVRIDNEEKIENEKPQRVDNRPRKRKAGFHEEMFSETSYYMKDGLRWVYPYKFTFTAHIKGRWLGCKVLDVFKKEFHMETEEYYVKAIKAGKIKVNDRAVTAERVLTPKDVLKTQVHRHEPPVIGEDIEFLENNDQMVVINKPPSIPVHPCGRYRHNTIVFILGKQYNLTNLHTIHRIDRLTSGILMFAKTAERARELETVVKGRILKKQYLARVVGEFPQEEVTIEEPIDTVSHKIGFCAVSLEGKPCKTIFKRIAYNGTTSLVQCTPHTGRMHQIRVHLQYLGHPIINDPIYNHPTAWGEHKGKKGSVVDTQKVMDELIRTRKDASDFIDVLSPTTLNKKRKIEETSCSSNQNEQSSLKEEINISPHNKLSDANIVSSKKNEQIANVGKIDTSNTTTTDNERDAKTSNVESETTVKATEDPDLYFTSRELGESYYDEHCTDCQKKWKVPNKHELVMYLHAHKYTGPDWEYTTKTPTWAEADWK